MAKSKQSGSDVSQKDVASMTRKLEAFGAGLPAGERAALQVLTSRGQAVGQTMVSASLAKPRLSAAVEKVFVDILKGAGAGKEGWAKIGPIWYKSGGLPGGEEVEFTQKVIIKGQNR